MSLGPVPGMGYDQYMPGKRNPENNWGFCPACIRERRTVPDLGIMTAHRKWKVTGPNPWDGVMIPCNGSGQKKLNR